ncbi:hypothetical protein OG394_11485 [Kribbella sp. NBC_01245]|nr:hypothetical protein [Kribbella sp. NBC_01245]
MSFSRLTDDGWPRSTRIHCGSIPSTLAHRVVVLPSTANFPMYAASSMVDVSMNALRDNNTSAATPELD